MKTNELGISGNKPISIPRSLDSFIEKSADRNLCFADFKVSKLESLTLKSQSDILGKHHCLVRALFSEKLSDSFCCC